MLFSRKLNFHCYSIHYLRLVLSSLAIYSSSSLANSLDETQSIRPIQPSEINECPVTTFQKISSQYQLITDDRIQIYSKSSSIEKDQLANFSGGVTLLNKDHQIKADNLSFNRQTSAISADGNIQYQNSGINIFADKMGVNEKEQATTLTGTSYQLANNPGHGSAKILTINASGTLSLIDSTYTTCVGEVPDWQIQASEIKISTEENIGQVYHAKIRFFDVPVLYIPYFSFPVTDERKSGFLYPIIKTTTLSGLEIETPYYWNISENMDATITPHFMSKRGTQLLTEFRYLSDEQYGSINLEYLNKDDEIQSNDPRYLARIQHVGTFSENFRAYVDYTTISDDNYLIDIRSDQYNSNDAYLYQIGELSYFGDNWQSTMKVQGFEVLGDHVQSYKTLPQIDFSLQQPISFFNGEFDLYSEVSSFRGASIEQPDAERYHVEAGLTFPISAPAWFLNSEFRLLQTNYKQENIPQGSELEESVSRTLPKIRLHGGINLDRNMSLFNQNYTQTLEPQLQYLYVADKNQDNIGLYDTTVLRDDYSGLFRDRRHSGLDRVSQANQYSWGVTSRILDPSNVELLRFSIGQISYLNNSFDPTDGSESTGVNESALAVDLFFRVNHQWQVSSDLQYNTKDNENNRSQFTVDYQYDKDHTLQLNHRYTRDVSGSSIEQVSLLTNFSINKDWKFVGRITQDLKLKRSLETYAGFQYESCCWAIRIAYHRNIVSNLEGDDPSNENRDDFDSGFMVQFVIKGLDGKQGSVSTQEMFNKSIFGYKQPYFLNN